MISHLADINPEYVTQNSFGVSIYCPLDQTAVKSSDYGNIEINHGEKTENEIWKEISSVYQSNKNKAHQNNQKFALYELLDNLQNPNDVKNQPDWWFFCEDDIDSMCKYHYVEFLKFCKEKNLDSKLNVTNLSKTKIDQLVSKTKNILKNEKNIVALRKFCPKFQQS